MIKLAVSDDDIESTYDIMLQLRPALARKSYVTRIRSLMTLQGYHLASLSTDQGVRAVAGYRYLDMLYCGRFLSIDDLATDEAHRSVGYGAQLINWLVSEGRRERCNHIELISNTSRRDAHRFYFRHGFTIDAFHFRREL